MKKLIYIFLVLLFLMPACSERQYTHTGIGKTKESHSWNFRKGYKRQLGLKHCNSIKR